MRPTSKLNASPLVWSLRLSVALAIGIAAMQCFRGWQAKAKSQRLKIESAVTLLAEGRGGVEINLANGATIPTEYSGDIDFSQARPVTLAAGDFDGDGVEDLICGYGAPNGGLLTLHRGNVESIFPGASEIQPAPFFPAANTFAAPEPPDFLVVGDFNNDGRQDVVTARRDGDALNFFKGDGQGNLQSAERISLSGKVTTLAAGQLNRNDGLKDLAIGITGPDGARVLVFESWNGALSVPPALAGGSEAESFALPHPATAFAIVSLAENGFGDLAIASGNELLVVHGRDRQLTLNKESRRETEAVVSRQTFDSKIIALTTGNFTGGLGNEIVLLDENGSLHRVGYQNEKARPRGVQSSNFSLPALEKDNLKVELSTPVRGNALVKARVSASGARDDLILLDRENGKMYILNESPSATAPGSEVLRLSATFDGDAVAAIPMRLNKDGLDDLVFLSKDKITPSVVVTEPQAVFVVNSTGNGGDSNTADGVCNDGTGACTLRAAIQQANASAGADEVRFNIPGAPPFTFAPNNLGITDPVETITIDGTTQPGFTGTPIIEIDGSNVPQGAFNNGINFSRTFGSPALLSSNSVLRGIVLNRHKSAGVRINQADLSGIRIENCYIGTDVTGTIARPNAQGGIVLGGNTHRIGGTIPAAGNVIAGNDGPGINLPGAFPTLGVLIASNFIGTDRTGTADLGNNGDGIFANGGTMTVGGTQTADTRNIISGNSGNGINVINTGVIIQNNRIGTSADGNTDLGNDKTGLRISGGLASTIGGTAAGTRNLISGNGRDGIELNFGDTHTIQGNFIGTKADGTTLLTNDRHAIFLTNFTARSVIGGDTVTPGTCDGPCNVIAFGAGGTAISLTNQNPPNPAAQPDQTKGRSIGPADSPNGNGNDIERNKAIQAAVDGGKAIFDLNNDGRTPNDLGDPDDGPNHLQNSPVLDQCAPGTQASNSTQGSTTQFSEKLSPSADSVICPGTFNSVPSEVFDLNFYIQSSTGNTFTSIFLGTSQVTTNAMGDATFNQIFPQAPAGSKFFALARRKSTGDTSEDSLSVGVSLCTYTVSPLSFEVGPEGGNRSVGIDTQLGCAWTAASNSPFITNVTPPSGFGPGIVTFNVTANSGAARTGTLSVAGKTVTVNQTPASCSFVVAPLFFSVLGPGGASTVNVNTQAGCSWTAVSNSALDTFGSAFITNVAPASGVGPGSVNFTVSPNKGLARRGTLTVAGQTVTVDQGTDCTYTVNPLIIEKSGGNTAFDFIQVTTQAGCMWQVTSNDAFIRLFSTGGTGSGSASFRLTANDTGATRHGTLTVAGQTVTVTQEACEYTVNPTSFNVPVEGMDISVNITTDVNCPWKATSNFDFIKGEGGGSGNGIVGFEVLSNVGPKQRVGTITVAGKTVTVTQTPCSYRLICSPHVSASGGVFDCFISTALVDSCQWQATFSPSSMGTLVPSSGTGKQDLTLTINPNSGNASRTGTVTITGGSSASVFQPVKGSTLDFDGDNRVDIGTVGTGNSSGGNAAILTAVNASVASEAVGLGSLLQPAAQLNWVISNSSNGSQRVEAFGLDTDKIVPGDYNGDGLSDFAVWRPSNATWMIARPTGVPAQNFDSTQLGVATDIPVQADYDGDGRTDIAVFRPSDGDWRILRSTDNQVRVVHFGLNSDRLVPADYDGDGHADVAVWRPSDRTWHILQSSNNTERVVQLGSIGDQPVPADYDGDFKTDLATFTPSTGTSRITRSSTGALLEVNLGLGDDVPVPADYDGDLKTDVAVWRPGNGTWLILRSSDGVQQTQQLGQRGDVPIPSAILPPSSVVQFSASNYNVTEDCTTVTITVNRISDTSAAASVDYTTSDVTASERRDYITSIGRLSFAPGETSKSFAILINEDSRVEGNETFNVNLSNPFGISLGGLSIATVTINDDSTEPAANVIDDAPNFVCQHYHDFLNRQADAPGLAFWTNEITSCGLNQACIEAKRINVSAAYFLSIEFQQTGYLVERIHKSAFGDAGGASTLGGAHQLSVPTVRFSDFISDTEEIGNGLVVGQAGWETVLENNKQAFTSDFVQRTRFTTAFPMSMTPAQFVDKLNSNAGNVLSASDRATAIALFGSATDTSNTAARAQALRQVAENQNLATAEFNRAFVLMQFFGYLRRNPNDLPDADYTGYDFWLAKLIQFNGNYNAAEMVKAFIVSTEYRQRFGP